MRTCHTKIKLLPASSSKQMVDINDSDSVLLNKMVINFTYFEWIPSGMRDKIS